MSSGRSQPVAPTACAAASESKEIGSSVSLTHFAVPVRVVALSTLRAYRSPADRSPLRFGTNLKIAPDSPARPAFWIPRDSEMPYRLPWLSKRSPSWERAPTAGRAVMRPDVGSYS